MGDLKDRQLMKVAKLYADEMHIQSESGLACDRHKQLARKRMEQLGIKLFTGHGIEFALLPGEEKFKARQLKKGDRDTSTEPGDGRPEPEFETEPDGRPIDEETSPAGESEGDEE
jgi:hypothetical protein